MDEVARRAGMASGAIYGNFRNRAELLVALGQTYCSAYSGAARASRATGPELRGDSSLDRMTIRILALCYVLACDEATEFFASSIQKALLKHNSLVAQSFEITLSATREPPTVYVAAHPEG